MKLFQLTIRQLLIILICTYAISCSKKEEATESVSTINQVKLDEAFSSASQIVTMKSLVVSHRGIIIKEAYWNGGGGDTPHDIRSITKSITGLLVGVAIENGYLTSVDQKIGGFFTPFVESFPSNKQNISVRHLLSMSSGLQGDELADVLIYNNWASAANQVENILMLPVVYQPGEYFTYHTGIYHLLSVILSRTTGISTKNFAERNLFAPQGINSWTWITDKQGYNNGGAGLQLTPKDMVKIGELVLNLGTYKGNRIISADWISQLTQSKIAIHNAIPFAYGYSYGWWLGQTQGNNFIMAMGWGGQFIIIVPNLNLVVAATNVWSGVSSSTANDNWYRTLDLLLSGVISSFKE